ncbi:GtrA family protein [Pseudomonas plecoglossicida]|uniref:Bactoprenol-linked glucose translocase n=1 Tax=Pseudomonas plecoglossicida TaxID=70775 RepID=A0AAD0QXR2_PSEDL|nr:GtrA family protein [Pseudomonas plecoglossicida]AXM96184.1 GtrA family protein [Pseudomonas plecoglossicida]EPB93391.1 GtrA family protein [Pseudomonas plecoglossicida NB2011]QLB56942.1 GtrA family protein [Pseudomonas plecoglossicida]GLR39292.1 hypothetical protein GCM10011247_46910 [Pseudomonas plecoglossicida]
MRFTTPTFFKYLLVGCFNTAIHAAVFTAMQLLAGTDQAISNLTAFFVALSFSFMANARYTFRAPVSLLRYLTFVAGMGSLSVAVGSIADLQSWRPMATVVVYSALSLLLGFLLSRWIFTERRGWLFR